MSRIFALVAIGALSTQAAPRPSQPTGGPETVIVRSIGLGLRALLWRPPGAGPFPAILFSHGSYSANDPMPPGDPATLGPVFVRHGYVFLFLFRQGVGLSAGEGTADGDQMDRAFEADGIEGRNRVQLQVLFEELNETFAGLTSLRAHYDVDPRRVGVVGHSFGGSLSVMLAEQDETLRAVVVFGGAAASWERSPVLRGRLLGAVRRAHAPIFFIHAANHYSTGSGEALAAERERWGRPHRLTIYPAAGRDSRDGHNLVYQSVATWEADVFGFLDAQMKR